MNGSIIIVKKWMEIKILFRRMRRCKQELSMEECIEILKNEPRGVLAVHGENGYPYAFPMNHIYFDGKLYFHCAKEGHKLEAIESDHKVSFCVMDKGFRKDGDWALNIKSVVIFGHITKMDDKEKALHILRELGLKHYPVADSYEEEIKKTFDKVQLLELRIDHMSGKLVNES